MNFQELLEAAKNYQLTWIDYVFFAIQIYSAIHAFRRKHIIWGIISLLFSISAIFYFVLYIIPELRGKKHNLFGNPINSGVKTKVNFDTKIQEIRQVQDLFDPKKELERLENLVKESDTVHNKKRLADVYMRNKAFEKAYALYTSCLNGVFKDDPYLLLDAAKAAFANKNHQLSIEHIRSILTFQPKFADTTMWFVLAKNFEAIGNKDKALEIYEKYNSSIRGEEAKYNYAQLLFELGDTNKSAQIAKDIVEDVSKGTPMYKQEQEYWMKEAKKLLVKMGESKTLKLNNEG